DVPTMAESGLPELTTITYYGFLGPAGTPAEVITRINHEVNEALKSPELRASMAKAGFEPVGGAPTDYGSLMAGQLTRWRPVGEGSGLEMDWGRCRRSGSWALLQPGRLMAKRRDPRRSKRLKLASAGLLCAVLGALSAQAEPAVVTQAPIPDEVWKDMVGKSWHPNRGCPSRANLVLLTVPYRNFNDQAVTGELVVAKSVAPAIARIFSALYASPFRIERMERIDKYGGSDDDSMAANNTSA